MWWIFIVAMQLSIVYAGIRAIQRTGMWSWPRFLFVIGFGGIECAILLAPIVFIHDVHNPYFWPIYATPWIVVLVNFVWLIRTVRRWKPIPSKAGC